VICLCSECDRGISIFGVSAGVKQQRLVFRFSRTASLQIKMADIVETNVNVTM